MGTIDTTGGFIMNATNRSETSMRAVLKERSTAVGAGAVVTGVILLVGLRFWTSPIAIEGTGRTGISPVEFAGIPLLLALVAIGIMLFVWRPTEDRQ